MKIIKEEIVHKGKHITRVDVRYVTNRGKENTWEKVNRNTFGKIVAIFALTLEKEVILVKQFRIPSGSYVVELPAGLADKKGENSEDLARRELQEETGYEVFGRFEPIVEGPFNSGMTDDELVIFFGDNARKTKDQLPDDAEEVEVMKVPFDQLVDFCTEKHPDFKVDIKILNVLPVIQKKGYV